MGHSRTAAAAEDGDTEDAIWRYGLQTPIDHAKKHERIQVL